MFYHDLKPNNNGWGPWRKKFLWLPKKITFTNEITHINLTKWFWLTNIYVRSKVHFYYSEGTLIDITTTIRTDEYAKDLFDIMKKT